MKEIKSSLWVSPVQWVRDKPRHLTLSLNWKWPTVVIHLCRLIYFNLCAKFSDRGLNYPGYLLPAHVVLGSLSQRYGDLPKSLYILIPFSRGGSCTVCVPCVKCYVVGEGLLSYLGFSVTSHWQPGAEKRHFVCKTRETRPYFLWITTRLWYLKKQRICSWQTILNLPSWWSKHWSFYRARPNYYTIILKIGWKTR